MKIFLSWSGDKSHAYAQAFAEWLPCVVQAVDPWLSSTDIDRGAAWFNEIFEQLKDINFGILFITRENQSKPWIMFEAGALSKGLRDNRICTLLCDLNVRDIETGSPLRNINHSERNKAGVLALLKTVNKSLENGVKEERLEKTFDAMWPDLVEAMQKIEQQEPTEEVPQKQDSDVLNDILNSVLSIDKKVSKNHGIPITSRIHKSHADKLLGGLLHFGADQNDIRELMSDLVPRHWLEDQIAMAFDKE